MGKQYKVAKKGAKYIYKKTKAPKGRSRSNSTKPITENQILDFKKLQQRVKKLDSPKISNSYFHVHQKVRREEDRRTFHIAPGSVKFENIDPKYLDRGDYHEIKEDIQKKIVKVKKEKKLQIERDLNLKKYGISETNNEREKRKEKEKNYKEYGISETNMQRTRRINSEQREKNYLDYGIRETNSERKLREAKQN